MRVVVCRVTSACCVVDGAICGEIREGLLLFAGFHMDDKAADVSKVAQKVGKLRLFCDENGKINKSTADIGGSALIIPNFTLFGSVKGCNRPDFTKSCPPAAAHAFFEQFKAEVAQFFAVESGIFGADMQVTAQNDGPVTVIIDSREL